MLLNNSKYREPLSKKVLLGKYSTVDLLEFILRIWMGYTLIINSGVGTITPLEDLGMPDHVYKIIKAMWDTGYMMHLVKLIELLAGILLIFNILIPIVLIMLFPVVINIYGVHLFLFNSVATSGLSMLIILAFLSFRYRKIFMPLFKIKYES